MRYLGVMKIFRRVLFEALNGGGADLKDVKEVDSIYQAYILKTGDKGALEVALWNAYGMATNPRLMEASLKPQDKEKADEEKEKLKKK